MPCVELYRSKTTSDIVLCSFVFCKELGGGYTPTGPLVHFSWDLFIKDAAAIITKEFELFHTREYGIKSVLYDEMSASQRRRFLAAHDAVILSWPLKGEPINIRVGSCAELYDKIAFPFDIAVLADCLARAFAKAAAQPL